MATRKKLSAASKVRAFLKTNPNANSLEVVAATGVKLNDVHSTLWRDKTKARAKKANELVNVMGITMSKDDLSNITAERMAQLAYEVSKPKQRMQQAGQPTLELAADVTTDAPMNITMEEFKEEPKVDMVNSPPHYTVGGIEVIDFIEAKLTIEEFRGYLQGNILKYSSRVGFKGDAAGDVSKLIWYANKLQKTFPA
jgi:hypothetical protein